MNQSRFEIVDELAKLIDDVAPGGGAATGAAGSSL